MIRVFVVAEVRLYREGLEQILGREPSIDVVGTASYREEAIGWIRELSPDITLLDCAMPEGAVAVRLLLEAAPNTRVVVLAIPEVEADIVAWAEAGVSGYVPRDGALADLVTTVEGVASDEMPCSPKVSASLLKHVGALAARIGGSHPQPRLTHREYEVIDLVGQGLSNKEIARVLQVAVPTVKNHVHSILGKLQVHRRVDALSRLGRSFRMAATREVDLEN